MDAAGFLGAQHDKTGHVDAQPTKGMGVSTHCHTVDQFVASFHRDCEPSAIFIANARRPVGAVMPFSFELANEERVLVGIGKVVEEFTTVDNRFGRAGIVIAVQKLTRESVAVFKCMLAARNEAPVDRPKPPPVFARASTMTIPVETLHKVRTLTRPLEVHIPTPVERASTKPRTSTKLGIPTITKTPAKGVMQIPNISPRRDGALEAPIPPSPLPRATPMPDPVPSLTPRRGNAPDTFVEGDPDAIAEQDTFHDDFPYALRHEIQAREDRAAAARPVDVDDGWEIEQTPAPVADVAAPAAREALPLPPPLPPPPDVNAIPHLAIYSETTRTDVPALRDDANQLERSRISNPRWGRRAVWVATVTIAASLSAAAVFWFLGTDRIANTGNAVQGHDQEPPPRAEPPMADERQPMACEPQVIAEQRLMVHEPPSMSRTRRRTAVEQQRMACEQQPIGSELVLAHELQPIVPEPPTADEIQGMACVQQPELLLAHELPVASERRTVCAQDAAIREQPPIDGDRELNAQVDEQLVTARKPASTSAAAQPAIKQRPTALARPAATHRVVPKRPTKRCASLDCL